jgi:hypothetical protein
MHEYLKEINKIMEAFHSGNLTMGEFKDKIGKLWHKLTEQKHLKPQNQVQERSPSQTIRSRKSQGEDH